MNTFAKITALLAIGLAATVALTGTLKAEGTFVKEDFSCSVALADKKELESNINDTSFTAEQRSSFKSTLKTTNKLLNINNCKGAK